MLGGEYATVFFFADLAWLFGFVHVLLDWVRVGCWMSWYYLLLWSIMIYYVWMVLDSDVYIDKYDNFYLLYLIILPCGTSKIATYRSPSTSKYPSHNTQVNNFKKHLHKLNTTKSNLNKKYITPWQPTFSISRHKNRYHKSIIYIDCF